MLVQFSSNNFSFVFALSYFCFYSTSLILFFTCLAPFLTTSNNLSSLARLSRYQGFSHSLFISSIFSLLGIPPLCLFAPKFAGLITVWVHSNYFFFFFALLLGVLSFSVYLQILDLLFSWNKQPNDNKIEMEYVQSVRGVVMVLDTYSKRSFMLLITFINVFGFFYFKDLFFLISLFV